MNIFSDPLFLLFLGFTIFAVIYGSIVLYITFKEKDKKAFR